MKNIQSYRNMAPLDIAVPGEKESPYDNTWERDVMVLLKKKIKDDFSFFNPGQATSESYREKIFIMLRSIIAENYPGISAYIDENLIEKAISEVFGLGPIEKYISDREITDIFIQDMEMLVIKNGVKQYMGKVFDDIDDLYLLIDRIKFASGKTVDQRVPFLNTELANGSRCSIVIPPVADRVYITIRVFNCLDFDIDGLLKLKMFDNKRYALLKELVANRKNILIAGATGSGKTTLLNTLAKLIDKNEIINLIQDTPEIRMENHPYIRMLTTRPKSRETDNEINQDRLVFETLRMKADRIILGEVRDRMAAYQLLQALNTGHRGSFSTIHSDSAYDALLRLEMLAMEYRSNLAVATARKIIARAIDAVIFLEFENDEQLNIKNRKIKELVLIDSEIDAGGDYRLTFH